MKEVPRLTCRNLTVFRGGHPIIRDLSFDLPHGQALYVSGPNGSGKTTLLRGLATLSSTTGEISWENKEIGSDLKDILCYVGHQTPLKSTLTVSENLNVWGQNQLTYAEVFGLTPLMSTPSRFLSAGQRRRLTLACLLNPTRPLWLLDEPTVGLDEQSQKAFNHIMDAHMKDGGLIILTGHQKPTFPVRELIL